MGGKRAALRRFLPCIGAASVLSLVISVGSASAKTVYDYVYWGTFIDGATIGKPFDSGLAGLAYDSHSQRLLVADSGTPGVISRYTLPGTPAPFASLGRPWFQIEPSIEANTDIAIDQSGGPTDGNFYVRGGGFAGVTILGYKPDGSPLPSTLKGISGEASCGVAVSPDGKEILHSARGGIFHFEPSGDLIRTDFVGPEGIQPGVKIRGGELLRPCDLTFDNNGDLYALAPAGFFSSGGTAFKLKPDGLQDYMVNHREDSQSLAVDHTDNNVFILNSSSFELYDEDGRLLGSEWGGAEGSYPGLGTGSQGIVVDPATHDVWVASKHEYSAGGITHVEKFVRTNPHVIPDTTATPPEYPDPEGERMIMTGILNADGVETTDCHFEYGVEPAGITEGVSTGAGYEALNQSIPCQQGNKFLGSDDHVVSAEIPTQKGVRYHFKLSAKNGNGQVATSNVESFVPQGEPILPGFLAVDRINTDGVRFLTEFDPNGGNASYHFEWGPKGSGFSESTPESATFGFLSGAGLFNGENTYLPGMKKVDVETKDLEPGVTYEYRVVVTNEAGSVTTPPQEFTTYTPDSGVDNCGNAQVRQQTQGSLLLDCRAYELVSAADTGGYDVASDLVPGQDPLDAYPDAEGPAALLDRLGVVPGIAGNPTNLGRDPYVAVRGSDGWTTRYVGLPANGMADAGAFGSPLLRSGLEPRRPSPSAAPTSATRASPTARPTSRCGVPDGSLEKGMAGTLNPPADPVGEVRKPISADGTHLVFGTDARNSSMPPASGSISVYDRNLETNATQVVSTTPAGLPMTGEVAAARRLRRRQPGPDRPAGRRRWRRQQPLRPLHARRRQPEIDRPVADTPSGVIYNGMTADGGTVFFTTADQLAGDTRRERRPLPGRGRLDEPGAGVPALDRHRRHRQHRLLRTARQTGTSPRADPTTAAWSVPAGGAGIARDEAPSTSSARSCSTAPARAPRTRRTSTSSSRASAPHYVGEIDSSIGKPPPAPPATRDLDELHHRPLRAGEPGRRPGQRRHLRRRDRNGGRIARFDLERRAAQIPRRPRRRHQPDHRPDLGGRADRSADRGRQLRRQSLDGAIYAMQRVNAVQSVYSRSGVMLGELTGFGEACGVAVDQETGELYRRRLELRRHVPVHAGQRLDPGQQSELHGDQHQRPKVRIPATSASTPPGTPTPVYYSTGTIKKLQRLATSRRHRRPSLGPTVSATSRARSRATPRPATSTTTRATRSPSTTPRAARSRRSAPASLARLQRRRRRRRHQGDVYALERRATSSSSATKRSPTSRSTTPP